MIRFFPMLLLLTSACVDPIENCEVTGLDCCTSDAQCEDTYPSQFPFCHASGDTTGVCAECQTAEDCDVYETCLIDSTLGGFCYDPE